MVEEEVAEAEESRCYKHKLTIGCNGFPTRDVELNKSIVRSMEVDEAKRKEDGVTIK